MTEKALTVSEERQLAAQTQLEKMLAENPDLLDMWGGENLEEGDVGQPPRLKLAHRDDDEIGVKAGQFFNTLTGETYDALEIVVLLPLGPTRVEYYRPYTRGEPPLCASDDCKMPRQVSDRRPLQDRKAGPCATCPQAQWADGPKGERVSPPCTRQRNFMVTLREEPEEYMRYVLQRSAIPAARDITALAMAAGLRKSMVLASKFVKSDKGDYYEPIVTGGERLKPAELLRVIEVRAEVDRLVREGAIRVAADEEVDFNESNGYAADPPPDQEPEELPF